MKRPSNEKSVNEKCEKPIVKEKVKEKEKEKEKEREKEKLKEIEKEKEKEREKLKEIEKEKEKEKLKEMEKEQMKSVSLPSTPKPEKEKRSFLNLFGKKTTSTENIKKQSINNTAGNKKASNESTTQPKVMEKAFENLKNKLQKQRQNSIEENKVVIDHYSDLVRELGGRPRSRNAVPIYMNNEAVREAAAKAELDELSLKQQQNMDQMNYGFQSDLNKRNLNEDDDTIQMLEVAKKMNQYTEQNHSETISIPLKKDLVEISVEHTKSISYSVREIKQSDLNMKNDAFVEANVKRLTETTRSINSDDKNDNVVDTKIKQTSTKVHKLPRSRTIESDSIRQCRSKSKSPISERRTSLSSTVLKVTRMPINNAININQFAGNIDINLPASPSPTPEPEKRCKTPDQIQYDAEQKVRSTLNYTVDLAMFSLACWLYIFRDARLAIPIIILMIFRRVKDAFEKKLQKWTKRKSQ